MRSGLERPRRSGRRRGGSAAAGPAASGGSSVLQSGGCASAHRGWKRQPFGRSIGLGGSPTTPGAPEARPGTSRGTAWTSPRVYGWRGLSSSSFVSAVSTIRPRYITATRSQTWRTTARLWAIRSTVRPSCSRSSASRFSTVACTDTSSAETGSSATRTSGSRARARAIATRWRWPPENWPGCASSARAESPTRSSSSRQRASTWSRGTMRCARSSSASVCRTVIRGFSDEYGSWKTIWI